MRAASLDTTQSLQVERPPETNETLSPMFGKTAETGPAHRIGSGFDRPVIASAAAIGETAKAERQMSDMLKSAAVHGLIGLTALAVVPVSCMLALRLTGEERTVRDCIRDYCEGPLIGAHREVSDSAAERRVRVVYGPGGLNVR